MNKLQMFSTSIKQIRVVDSKIATLITKLPFRCLLTNWKNKPI